jgi:hypothetical protein
VVRRIGKALPRTQRLDHALFGRQQPQVGVASGQVMAEMPAGGLLGFIKTGKGQRHRTLGRDFDDADEPRATQRLPQPCDERRLARHVSFLGMAVRQVEAAVVRTRRQHQPAPIPAAQVERHGIAPDGRHLADRKPGIQTVK